MSRAVAHRPAVESPPPLTARLAAVDWAAIAASLDARGYATTPPLLGPDDCRELAALYAEEAPFRSRVVMQRHAFGQGEYKYFAYPLPPAAETLRQGIYPHLAPVANRWRETLGEGEKFPPTLDAFLAECHAAGQPRPTPLLLQYGADDYNCLHQDLYGPLVFPLQLTVLLSDPAHDFSGGEFVLVEQRPRAQSKAEVVPLHQGEAVIFAVHHRPVRRHPRLAPRHAPPRRQPRARGPPPHARHHFSRRAVIGLPGVGSIRGPRAKCSPIRERTQSRPAPSAILRVFI